jgi:hypothetical protein
LKEIVDLVGDLLRKQQHGALGINALDVCPHDFFCAALICFVEDFGWERSLPFPTVLSMLNRWEHWKPAISGAF